MFYNYVQGQEAAANATFLEPGALAGTPAGRLYTPHGIVKKDKFQSLFDAWSAMPLDDPSKALAPGGDVYLWADMTFTNEFNYHQDGRLQLSFNTFFLTNTKSDEDLIACIQRTTDIVNASPLRGKAFVYADIYTFWSTFIGIEAVMWKALGLVLAVIFGSSLLLLQSPTSALIVAAMSMLIVVNTYGICVAFLKFNSFIVSFILAGAGLSIEFTAHISSGFVSARGTPEQRVAHVMKETYPAIIQGSISTLFGFLPLYFSRIPFVAQYIFMPFAILVFVGMFDGMILLPGLLALSAHFEASRPVEEGEVGDADVKVREPAKSMASVQV